MTKAKVILVCSLKKTAILLNFTNGGNKYIIWNFIILIMIKLLTTIFNYVTKFIIIYDVCCIKMGRFIKINYSRDITFNSIQFSF